MIEIDEHDAVVVLAVVTDALEVLTLTRAADPVSAGAVLLADEILRRIWPRIDQARAGEAATSMRLHIARAAAVARRIYGLHDVH
jgi:hypothetical protein